MTQNGLRKKQNFDLSAFSGAVVGWAAVLALASFILTQGLQWAGVSISFLAVYFVVLATKLLYIYIIKL